jgi:hypothetical protein
MRETSIPFIFPGIKAYQVILPDGHQITFRPDVTLQASIGGKKVILEAHPTEAFDNMFIEKMKAFMRSPSHQGTYLILITDNRYLPFLDAKLDLHNIKIHALCDEHWVVDRQSASRMMRTGGVSYSAPREHAMVHGGILNGLRELQRRFDVRSKPVPRTEPVRLQGKARPFHRL